MANRSDVMELISVFEGTTDANLKRKLATLIRSTVNEFVGGLQREPATFTQIEIDYLHQGKKIEAIKSVRDRLTLSLLDAKRYVEEYMGPYYILPAFRYDGE